jgi:hypothetical protein
MELTAERSKERINPSFICFLIWTFILVARPQDYLTFMMPLRPVLVISIITFAVMFLEARQGSRPLLQRTEVKLILALYAIMIVGIPLASHRGVAFRFVFTAMPLLIMYFTICIMQLTSLKRLNLVAGIIVVSVFFSASFYMQDALAHRGFRTKASQMYDPNDIAMIFATFIPMCLYILLGKHSVVMKIIAMAAALLGTAGIMLSGSRGGVLAFGVVAVFFLLGKTTGIKAFPKAVIIILLAFVFLNYFSVVEGRFQNIGSDYNISDEKGRFHIWKQNMAIMARNPILGSGAGCSVIALGQYRANISGTKSWQASHSSLLQLGTETGITGLAIFAALNILAIVSVRRIRKHRDHPLANFAFFVELAFYGFWVGGLLLSHAYSVNLYLLLGIAAALKYLYMANPVESKNGETITGEIDEQNRIRFPMGKSTGL